MLPEAPPKVTVIFPQPRSEAVQNIPCPVVGVGFGVGTRSSFLQRVKRTAIKSRPRSTRPPFIIPAGIIFFIIVFLASDQWF